MRHKNRILPLAWAVLGCGMQDLAGAQVASNLPPVDLPAALELVVAAAPPLVRYPLMGCIDDRGRLFIGDAAGLNLDKKGLEEQLPNRVLMLEDSDGDGLYDRSSIFADKMIYPSGGCWLDGSLYVASPPGIWKLTDTNGDGIADERTMIVGGFDGYSGNGTHVHGPILHPTEDRLFWCTGRTGKVVQNDGTVVRDGYLTGVWSCNPDGSKIEWHSLARLDNPVEVDFTADGQLVGTANLQFHQPRGDTLVQWLRGGVYESPDSDIRGTNHADLPHTLERMPILHNYGHVAVAGFMRYRSGALDPAWKDDLFVTFFNTQKVVRTRLISRGATYSATQHEFLKFNDPDAHFTDVIEDGDGTLLVLNTGGWVRRGCPSSLSEKPDLRGAVYRIRRRGGVGVRDPYGLDLPWASLSPDEAKKWVNDNRWVVREKALRLTARNSSADVSTRDLLDASRPHARLCAWEAISRSKRLDSSQREALLKTLAEPLDPALEHAVMFAAITTKAFDVAALREASGAALIRRLVIILEGARDSATADAVLGFVTSHFESPDSELSDTAIAVAARHPRVIELCHAELKGRLAMKQVSPGTLKLLTKVIGANLGRPGAQDLVTAMLEQPSRQVQRVAWQILGGQPGNVSNPAWISALDQSLAQSLTGPASSDLPLLMDAIGKLGSSRFEQSLWRVITDSDRPQPIRFKALAALSRPNEPLSNDAFALLFEMLRSGTSPTARVDAARLLTRVRLSKQQILNLAPVVATAAPIELQQLLRPMTRKLDVAAAQVWAKELTRSPYFGSLEESVIRSTFQSLSSDIYESILGPAVRAAAAVDDAKKRRLETLTAAAAKGHVGDGQKVFEAGGCVACHKVGELGRIMGPDLTHIGRIRQPRDLLEAILFPSATFARGFETHVVETADGATFTGMIKSESAEGLQVVDIAGQEKVIPQTQIIGQSSTPTSLMPDLGQSFTDQQLLDLVAWLVEQK